MASFVERELISSDGTTLTISEETSSAPRAISWPPGFVVRIEGANLVVVDHDGTVVAREGDRVRIVVGELPDGKWDACGGVNLVDGTTMDLMRTGPEPGNRRIRDG